MKLLKLLSQGTYHLTWVVVSVMCLPSGQQNYWFQAPHLCWSLRKSFHEPFVVTVHNEIEEGFLKSGSVVCAHVLTVYALSVDV